jgi:hypothetical protein
LSGLTFIIAYSASESLPARNVPLLKRFANDYTEQQKGKTA